MEISVVTCVVYQTKAHRSAVQSIGIAAPSLVCSDRRLRLLVDDLLVLTFSKNPDFAAVVQVWLVHSA